MAIPAPVREFLTQAKLTKTRCLWLCFVCLYAVGWTVLDSGFSTSADIYSGCARIAPGAVADTSRAPLTVNVVSCTLKLGAAGPVKVYVGSRGQNRFNLPFRIRWHSAI